MWRVLCIRLCSFLLRRDWFFPSDIPFSCIRAECYFQLFIFFRAVIPYEHLHSADLFRHSFDRMLQHLCDQRTKLNMIDGPIGAAMRIFLNLLLIPTMCIMGAAAAFTVSCGTATILKSSQIFCVHRLHLFTVNYLKPALVPMIMVFAIYLAVGQVHISWMLTPCLLCL